MGVSHITPEANSEILRQISGFYPTPATVVDMMLARLAPLQFGQSALEPSAGRGDIADRLQAHIDSVTVVEPHPVLAELLVAKGYSPIVGKFEDYVPHRQFDRIAMNPPFARGLDMEHVRRAFSMLAFGGVLVALMNDGTQAGDSTREQRASFEDWVCAEPLISKFEVERISSSLLLTSENLRPSHIPVKLFTLHKRGTEAVADGL
ncbi:class I SAM-dependent methyltransferase [uncultured Tateyamaria sp.]|uniref:class I SAM-dependent methyltransferase n=1 Tax=uncultured Tateyamaria sp. TaxID=455651 RepID=UPI00260A4726|nr:class I SAM-dependent methyltransferase [uncultured Tateyamaria sp.]